MSADALEIATMNEYAERICSLWHKSREQIIGIGRALLEAKSALPHGQFMRMVETELPFGPKSAQQFMRIASDPRISNGSTCDLLPNTARALDEVRKLDDDQLSSAVASGRINPAMTVRSAVELVQEMNRQRDEPPRRQTPCVPVEPEMSNMATSYAELVWLFRKARSESGVSQLELDGVAGWEEGYTSKLEIPDSIYGRRCVHPTFDTWIGSMLKACRVAIMVLPIANLIRTDRCPCCGGDVPPPPLA